MTHCLCLSSIESTRLQALNLYEKSLGCRQSHILLPQKPRPKIWRNYLVTLAIPEKVNVEFTSLCQDLELSTSPPRPPNTTLPQSIRTWISHPTKTLHPNPCAPFLLHLKIGPHRPQYATPPALHPPSVPIQIPLAHHPSQRRTNSAMSPEALEEETARVGD